MRRCLIALFVVSVAGAAGASTASATTCANTDTPVGSMSRTDARKAVICIVNAERAAYGLPSVRNSTRLMIAAQRHTHDMVRRNYFDHIAPGGSDPGARITAAGYFWSSYGENIAAGYSTPREVMAGWMASEGHCENMLNPMFTQLGVGVATAAASLGSGATGTWTQDFGLPRGASPRSSNTGPQHHCAYDSLKGIDGNGNVTASSKPVAAPAQDVGKLHVSIRHQGSYLIVRGRLNAADGTKVRLTITRHGRLAAWGTARLVGGRFAFRVPKGIGDHFVIKVAGKRAGLSLR